MKITALLLATAIIGSSFTAAHAQKKKRTPNPAMAPVEDVADLPRVLLIGDSISIGYTVATRELLDGIANVHRPLANCGPTTTGLAKIDAWLETGGAGKEWDLIHFNWGLHDLKYLGPNGENLAAPDAADSHQQVPPEDYRKNLTALVERLKETGAHLIWRNTTPVPEGAKGRVVGHSAAYNEIAAEVMEAAGIPTHDLFGMVQSWDGDTEFCRKADVHYTPAGSTALAEDTASVIRIALDPK